MLNEDDRHEFLEVVGVGVFGASLGTLAFTRAAEASSQGMPHEWVFVA